MTATDFERRIALTGCYNFRDLGGYETVDGRTVRWRRIFRSDALHGLTDEDVSQLSEIGLTAVFDLRSPAEVERDGIGSLFTNGVLHHHVPFVNHVSTDRSSDYFDGSLADLYARMLQGARPCINEVFSGLAESDAYPAVFHCAAGKDRTGIISGLLLSVLGVPDETIIADYAITDGLMADRIEAMRAASALDARYDSYPAHILRAEPATMATTLSSIKQEYGSVTGFLAECDITDGQLDTLRTHLLN